MSFGGFCFRRSAKDLCRRFWRVLLPFFGGICSQGSLALHTPRAVVHQASFTHSSFPFSCFQDPVQALLMPKTVPYVDLVSQEGNIDQAGESSPLKCDFPLYRKHLRIANVSCLTLNNHVQFM